MPMSVVRTPLWYCRLACALSVLVVGSESIHYTRTPGQPAEHCTVFHHMVKSAGSTIKSMLRRASAQQGLPKPGGCVTGEDRRIQACLEAFNSTVITGFAELVRGPLERAGRDCEYFTVMRDPIDRLVSAFFYCPVDGDVQIRPEKWCGYAEHDIPVTERLLEFAQYEWKNKAFHQMSFGMYCPSNSFCEPAQDLLASYTAVGLMEHWDLSMRLFDARVHSPVRHWNKFKQTNPGQLSGLREDVYSWARTSTDIHRALGADILLYSYAVSVFKEQTTESLGTIWQES